MAILEINTDLSARAMRETEAMDWVDTPMQGVTRRMLERDGEDGARRATSVVRYVPSSRFSPHTHRAGEPESTRAGAAATSARAGDLCVGGARQHAANGRDQFPAGQRLFGC